MSNVWFTKTKCVVVCGGPGTRLLPETEHTPKSMLLYEGKPIIEHIVNYWKGISLEFIFIVGYKKEVLIDFINTFPIKAEFIEEKELCGIANAISLVEGRVSGNFIVVLGDCVCQGHFDYPKNMEQAVGVWNTSNEVDIRRSYSVEIDDNLVSKVIEKPKEITNFLCGMGCYFFSDKLFDYIKITPKTGPKNQVELTHVIQTMVDSGENIAPLFFAGDYVNVNYSDNLR